MFRVGDIEERVRVVGVGVNVTILSETPETRQVVGVTEGGGRVFRRLFIVYHESRK